MTFINILKERLKEKKNKINVKAPISSMPGADWAELNITSLDESPVMLGTPTDNLKFRFQPLLSGSRCIPCPYRLDNCHGSLHQHFGIYLTNFNILIYFPDLV